MSKHKRSYKNSVFVDLFAKDKTAKAKILRQCEQVRYAADRLAIK